MRKITAKLLTTAYKSKIVKFILYEDLLQRRIYFLTFIESLEMIFSQYKGTCELIIYYRIIGRDDLRYYVKKESSNLLHTNIDVYGRRSID